MASYANLFIDQGANFTITVTANDGNGDPLDLSAYIARAKMSRSILSPIAKRVSITTTITDPPNGEITLSLTKEETDVLAEGRWYYDIEIEDGSGVCTRVVQGIITVLPSMTQ